MMQVDSYLLPPMKAGTQRKSFCIQAMGKKKGNKLRFIERFKERNGEKLSRITDLLPNNKAIAGLALSGEYMKTGKARYKCTNLTE